MRKILQASSLARRAILGATLGLLGALAACEDPGRLASTRSLRPISPEVLSLMEQKGTTKASPMLIRAYKKEAEFEVWKQARDGRYVHLKTFPMCRWSGQLGPKTREGDRQVPEGFYAIGPGQMNPNSNYYLSLNVGYPNAYDRSHGATGGLIMVHGACSSAGCFSMTDEQIAEIYAVARESFSGGQRAIQFQSLPFRMTAQNLAKHRLDPHIAFWRQLKEGSDRFEVTRLEPKVGVCNRHYVFNASAADNAALEADAACPALKEDEAEKALLAQKRAHDDEEVAELVAKGVAAVKIVYADGGQHPEFASKIDVSRPDALAQKPVEIALEEKKKPALVQVAAAQKGKDSGQAALLAKASHGATLVAKASQGATLVAKAEAAGAKTAGPMIAAASETAPVEAKAEAPFYAKLLGGAEATEGKTEAKSEIKSDAVAAAPVPTPSVLKKSAAKPVVKAAAVAKAPPPTVKPAPAAKIIALPKVIAGPPAAPDAALALAPTAR